MRGDRYTGRLVIRDQSAAPAPVIVLSRGWPVTAPTTVEAAATAIAAAGFAAFSYQPDFTRQDQSRLRPNDLVVALRAAVARLRSESGIDGDRIGVLGMGPIAGGVALMAASDDPWLRAVCVHNAAMDGESWMKELAELDGQDWNSLATDTMARLRTRTAQGTDPEPVPVTRSADIGEIDLTAFDHLLRFRPANHMLRIPTGQLRVTGLGGKTADLAADVVTQSCNWFAGALQPSDYDVLHESA